jgi:hypothetical protein
MASPNHQGVARAARSFQHVHHTLHLSRAAFHPHLRFLLVQHALVDQRDGLVAETRRQRADLLRLTPRGPRRGHHSPLRARFLVEIVEDHRALDQHFA